MRGKIRFVLGCLLGALFTWSGVVKVLEPAQFFVDVQNYELLPWRVTTVALALYLPWLEIFCGMAMVVRSLRLGALFIFSTLLLIFTAALLQAWVRGLNISCGCFGGESAEPQYLLWIGRDVGLLAVALVVLVEEKVCWKRDAFASLP